MVTQIVEIAENGHHLSKFRGFMTLKQDGTEIARVPLDNMTVLILSARQITLSKSLLMELAERKIPAITCGKNYHPLAFHLPYDTHFDQVGILWAQMECGLPFCKRLWQSIVREKINNQAIILKYQSDTKDTINQLAILCKRVKSGDPENMEAQAARYYWTALLGSNFRRDRQTGAENKLLNYGYSILRAATARAVCGAGLTPALGIHHRNRKNPFALVDDLMEPFRPLVDHQVRKITDTEILGDNPLSPEIKASLAKILDQDVQIEKGVSTVMNSLHRLAQTFVTSLQAKENQLEFPQIKKSGILL